jgi:hypothetical protein
MVKWNPTIAALAALLLEVLVCRSAQSSTDCSQRENAVRSARALIEAELLSSQYVLDSARADDAGYAWNVWFSTVKKNVKPSSGLVTVKKSSCAAEWQPLK